MTNEELEKKIDHLLDKAIMRTQKKRQIIEVTLLVLVIILITIQVI